MVAACATAPWWMPPAIVVAAKQAGVRVGGWEKDGWLRAVYRDVEIAFDGGRVAVEEVRVPVFGIWPRRENETPTIFAREVLVSLEQSARPRPPQAAPPSVYQIVSLVDRVWPEVQRWLPPAEIERARVDAGETRVDVASAKWDGASISIDGTVPYLAKPAALALSRRADSAFVLSGAFPEYEATIEVVVAQAADTVQVNAAGDWKGNRVNASARFGDTGFIPSAASIHAPAIGLDASSIGLSGYGPIEGALKLTWENGAFAGAARAAAAPAEGERVLPPLGVDVRADGTVEQVRLDAAHVSIPGMRMELSAPLEWRFAEGIPTTAARFDVSADLAELPWIDGTGAISGTAEIARGEGSLPVLDFELQGNLLEWRNLSLASLDLAGRWASPLLEIEHLVATIDDKSALHAEGEVDLAAQSVVGAKLHAEVDHASVLTWFPDLPAFSRFTADAEAWGAFSAVQHKFSVALQGIQGAPGGAVDAELSSTGSGIAQVEIDGIARSSAGIAIPFGASVTRDSDGSMLARVVKLSWEDDEGEWWHLNKPARVRLVPAETAGGVPLLAIEDARLEGGRFLLSAEGRIRLPAEGSMVLHLEGITGRRFRDLIPEAYRRAEIESLDLQADWNNGPFALEGKTQLRYSPEVESTYVVEAAFRSGKDPAFMTADLDILAESGVVLRGTGRLPLSLAGTEDGFSFRLPQDGPINLDLSSEANPVFWRSISKLTGWEATDPALQASLSGTLGEPRGSIAFSSRELIPPKREKGVATLPSMSDLSIRLLADENGIALEKVLLAVEHRWIRIAGKAPWATWQRLKDEQQIPWRDVEFLLATNPLPVAIASRAFPTVLAPDGNVSIYIKHKPGEGLAGNVWLHGASLRPIAPVGAIREINAKLSFDDYTVELPELTALVGRRPIEISGNGRIHPDDRVDFDLRATSTRVLLVRDAGLVVRAGLDLRVTRDSAVPPRITGKVDLGPSIYVSDLVSLIPTGGVTSPEQRPPFFSVEDQPFAQWTLDVDVQGDDFLRVENPFFVGTLSADFKLQDTLEEPQAIGRITSRAGTVVFPFARVPLENLEVTLTRESPYEPKILVSDSTRIFGYDVRIEATETAEEPRLLFSANPPMSSQAVFLMLTTGALPDESRAFSTSERARRIAFFLGKNLAAGLGIGGGGSDESRLAVRSGENFSREGRETVFVQYDLNGRWSMVGEYDRFDAYNGGIKFRLIDR